MWLCWSVAGSASLHSVARYFRRDRTSVVHARRRASRLLAHFPLFVTAAVETCGELGVPLPPALRLVLETESGRQA